MARYRFLAADLLSGVIRDEIPFDNVSISHPANGAGTFEATAPLRARPQRTVGFFGELFGATFGTTLTSDKLTRTNLDPGRTLILVERDGIILGDAVLWGVTVSDGQLQFTGASLWSYFARRHITETRAYTDVEQTDIAHDLVRWAQGSGSLTYGPTAGTMAGQIAVGNATHGTGKTRTRPYYGFELKNIAKAIEQLSAVRDGFDFDIVHRWNTARDTVERTFTTWYPARGRRTELVLELGVNIEDYALEVDAGSQAIRVHGIGHGEGNDMLTAVETDDSLLDVYPLTEHIITHKDVKRIGTLEDHAAGRLAARRLPITKPSMLNVRLGPQLPVGSWVTGDELTLRIADGWAEVDSSFRVDDWTLQVDGDGKETVDMALVETGVT